MSDKELFKNVKFNYKDFNLEMASLYENYFSKDELMSVYKYFSDPEIFKIYTEIMYQPLESKVVPSNEYLDRTKELKNYQVDKFLDEQQGGYISKMERMIFVRYLRNSINDSVRSDGKLVARIQEECKYQKSIVPQDHELVEVTCDL